MKSKEISKIFIEISSLLLAQGEDFRSLAYRKAGEILESGNYDAESLYRKGGIDALLDIPGVGESIALKIEEYIKTGKIKFLAELKKQLPIQLNELVAVEGLGYRKAKILYKKLKIKNLKDLELAAKKGKIREIAGFGEISEKNILEGIAFLKRDKGRFLLVDILGDATDIETALKNSAYVKKISTAGSLRRKKDTIGDIDFLCVSSNPKKLADFFVSLPGIVKIWGKGATKCSVRFEKGYDADLRIVPERSYGAALQYFTGSTAHNIALRQIAIEKGLKLNEYGVFKGNKLVAGKTEEEVYKILGLLWVPPEIRENNGEVELAKVENLPHLIEQSDLKGEFHCHSNWNGGKDSISDMASAAISLGYEYLGISDHTKMLKIEHGLSENQLIAQGKEIDKLNREFEKKKINFKILKGCEANILRDGRVDIKSEVLKKLDFVIAGVHSNFKLDNREMTKRLIRAISNPDIDIISHPTGRLIKRRDEYNTNFEKILEAAKNNGTILEINSSPYRLDLKDIYIKAAKDAGVKMAINSDSHHKEHLELIKFGIFQARRGWAQKEDIINTNGLANLKFKG